MKVDLALPNQGLGADAHKVPPTRLRNQKLQSKFMSVL